jgi:hypothetical protein
MVREGSDAGVTQNLETAGGDSSGPPASGAR